MIRFWKRKPPVLVLGQQMADARKAERARVEGKPSLPSPMPKDTYPTDFGIFAALNPKRIPLDIEQIGTTLPPVWFRGAGQVAFQSALEGALAGASVSGFLRSESGQKEQGHSLLVFLVECADLTHASMLEGFAQNAHHSSHIVCGCAEGRLVCVIVGHSVMHGVSSVETASSLARFTASISASMRRALAH